MSGSGRESLPDYHGWLGGPSGYPEVFGGAPESPGVVGISSRMTGSGREALPDVRE